MKFSSCFYSVCTALHRPCLKKRLLLLALFIVSWYTATRVSAQVYNIDNTQPYELVIPNLQVLHTNIVFSKEDQFAVTNSVLNGREMTIVGELITEDTLIKYLHNTNLLTELDLNKLGDSTLYYQGNKPTIKVLTIHCDSFVLNKSLWLPEINVLIHSRKVSFNNQSILRTSPRPYKEDESRTTQGEAGRKGGDVEIIAEVASQVVVQTDGSNGMGVQFPSIEFKAPGTVNVLRVYGCNEKEKCATEISYTGGDAIGFALTKDGCSDRELRINDYSFSYDWSTGKLTDKDAATRLTVTDYSYGKGGRNGLYKITTESPQTFKYSARDGDNGPFYTPSVLESQKDYNLRAPVYVDFSNIGNIITGSIHLVQHKQYAFYSNEIYQKSSPWFGCNTYDIRPKSNFVVDFSKTDASGGGKNSFREFEEKYRSYYYKKHPKDYYSEAIFTEKSSETDHYYPSIQYLRHKFILQKNKIRDIQYLSMAEKNAIISSIGAIHKQLQKLKAYYVRQDTTLEDNKVFYGYKIQEVNKLINDLDLASKHVSGKYLDEFNNPLGYRPVLSFPSISQLMNNAIKQDLELYLRFNDMGKRFKSRADTLANMANIETNLNKAIHEKYAELSKSDERIRALGIEGLALSNELGQINADIVKKEKELFKAANELAEKEKNARMGAKVLAVTAAAGATLAGGPAAGGLTYSIVDKLGAAANDNNYERNENVEATMRNINATALLNGISENKLEPLEEKMKDLEYRKSNGLFNNFKDWKVDSTTNNYVTTKLPQSLFQYKERKTELEKEIKKLKNAEANVNAMTSFAVKGAEEIYAIQVKSEYLEKAIARVKRQSIEYEDLGNRAFYQSQKMGDFTTRLRIELIKKGEINQRIDELSEIKRQINAIKLNQEAFYDPLIANKISSIENQSLERLKWMEYQLIKVFNYTQLKPFPAELTNYRAMFSDQVKAQGDVNAKIEVMKGLYNGTLSNIKGEILKDITKGHKQDDDEGAKIHITDMALTALNSEKKYIIDLYDDFNDEIIDPDFANIRIISVEMEDLKLSRPLKGAERIQLSAVFDNKGVLRKEDKFYLFDDGTGSDEIWDWTMTKPKDGSKQPATISASVNSDIYLEMLDFLIDKGENRKKGPNNPFTLKPAWSKITLHAKFEGIDRKDPVHIDGLIFKVRRDFERLGENDIRPRICDFRVDNSQGVLLEVKKDGKIIDTLSHSQYNVLAQDTKFELNAFSPDPNLQFSHWETQPVSLADSSALGPVLRFDFAMRDKIDYRVRPVFVEKEKTQLLYSKQNNAASPVKYVQLYNEPQMSSSPELSVPLSYLKKNMKVESTSVDGVKKVIYGLEAFFVRAKDLY